MRKRAFIVAILLIPSLLIGYPLGNALVSQLPFTKGMRVFRKVPTYTYRDFIWDGTPRPTPDYIERWQAEEEINRLIYALQNYIGRIYTKKEVDAVILALRNFPLQDKIRCTTFAEGLGKLFERLPDKHAIVTLPGKGSKSAQQSYNKNKTDLPFYVSLEPLGEGATGFILLIAITKFPPPSSPLWNGFLSSIKEKLPKAAAIILDLRGNQGGNDHMGRQLATLLYGTEQWGWNVSKILFNNQPITYVMFANNLQQKMVQMGKRGEDTTQLARWHRFLMQKAEEVAQQKNPPPYTTRTFPNPPSSPPRLQLPIFVSLVLGAKPNANP